MAARSTGSGSASTPRCKVSDHVTAELGHVRAQAAAGWLFPSAVEVEICLALQPTLTSRVRVEVEVEVEVEICLTLQPTLTSTR